MLEVNTGSGNLSPDQSLRCDQFFGRRCDPFGALSWVDMQDVHGVYLLQCSSLSLNDKEVDYSRRHEEASCKDISVAEINIPNDERSEEGEEEIPAPV